MFSNVGYVNIDGLKAAEKSQNENCQKTLTLKPGLKEMKFVPIWRTDQKSLTVAKQSLLFIIRRKASFALPAL